MADKLRKEKIGIDGEGSETASAYQSALASGSSADASSVASDGSVSPTSKADYDDLRDQNYKNLLDNQIQLESARQGALKASNSQLASQGLFGTGYASVARSGISNAYINAMNSANQSYNQTDIDISASERKQEESDASSRFQAMTTLLSQAQSTDDMDAILSEYGITRNGDGSFSGDYYDSLDEDSKRQFATTYRLLENSIRYGGGSYGDASEMINGLTMANGESAGTGDNYGLQLEIKKLFERGDLFAKEGMVVKLTNGRASDTNVAYVVYHNGKWYATSSGEYGKASLRSEIRDGKIV